MKPKASYFPNCVPSILKHPGHQKVLCSNRYGNGDFKKWCFTVVLSILFNSKYVWGCPKWHIELRLLDSVSYLMSASLSHFGH